VVSAVFLLAGSRLAAVFSVGMLVFGYAAGKQTAERTMWRWAALAFPLLVVVGFLGERLRSDEKGRTGRAALERVDKVWTAVDSVDRAFLLKSTLLRLASPGEHSVITRVPNELPFEQFGVLRIPVDFASEFLPRFAITGRSEDYTPRHWILNELGFVVNWETSMELTLLADAWLRGGFLGILVVGILVGFLLQAFEDFVYRKTRHQAVWFAALVFAATGLLSVESNGVASGLRAEVFYCTAGIALIVLARPPSWLHRPRRARVVA